MASQSLALPGILFVGEDERARLVAHLGPAAGWMIPKGVLGWSHEVSVVARDALGEDIRREAKIVMPEEQIPKGRMPLTHQAALKSPLVSVSGKLTQKLVDAGIRVHTVGADRITSSFYYIAEGGSEPPVRVEGDLVAAVGAMLGDRADNAAIERVLDGIVDRLVRSLSKDRVTEVSLELAAALPRAAADGTGTQDIDLESFEKELATLVGASEKYTPFLQEIASKITGTVERKVDIPLFGDARKVSQGPFELTVGEQAVPLATHDRWLATGPLTEPSRAPAPAAKVDPAPAAKPEPTPKPAAKLEPVRVEAAKVEPVRVEAAKVEPAVPSEPRPATPKAAPVAPISVGNIRPLAAPLNPPRPASNPPAPPPAEVAAAAPAATPQSGSTEPPPAAAAVEAKAAPEPQPTPEPLPVIQMETPTTPVVVPVRAEAKPAAKAEPKAPREERLPVKASTSTPVKVEEKGFPWLLVLVVLAAIAAAAFFFTRK